MHDGTQSGSGRNHETPQLGAPQMRAVGFAMLREALALAWADMRRAPVFGVIFSSAYVLIGYLLAMITWATGQSYWLVFAAIGFPLIGPFAAVGLYEVSRRLERDAPLDIYKIFGVVFGQSKRQLPSICAVIIIVFLFWFFLAHMIFALFLGLSTMTNISSSYEVYFTANGLTMLAVGTVVGGAFAMLLYSITVFALPLLLDREVDFVTAMIVSFKTVTENLLPMLVWGGFIAGATFAALLPWFLGLFITLPLFGHATWHLYRLTAVEGSTRD